MAVALTAEFSDSSHQVVAVDASLAKGRAYLAIRCADGAVYPEYLWLASETEFGGSDDMVIMYKAIPVGESPTRWPQQVATAITSWD